MLPVKAAAAAITEITVVIINVINSPSSPPCTAGYAATNRRRGRRDIASDNRSRRGKVIWERG